MHRFTPSLFLLLPFLPSCNDDKVEAAVHTLAFDRMPVGLEDMKMDKPAGFSEAKAALGKKLFFDKRLSSNGSMSCESCHYHDKGWTDGVRYSQKVDGSFNTRNSPTLYNTGFHQHLYWDGRAPSLEANIAAAWAGHMGGSDEVVAKVNGIAGYESEFQSAFGGAATKEHVAEALAHFVRTLRAGGSAFDRKSLSNEAKQGHALFMGRANCHVCHVPPLFTDMTFHNVGAGEKPDPGRGKIDEKLPGAFKTPTLRNVAKSAPYFHDGSVADLEAAVRYMASGWQPGAGRDPLLQKVELTDAEVQQLVAFLQSLSSDEKFEKPVLPE